MNSSSPSSSLVFWLIRCSFYINLPIGGAAFFVLLLFYKTPAAAKPLTGTPLEIFLQMDFLGTFTIMAALICYILALQWGGVTKSWNSSDVVGTLVGFLLLMVLFILIQWLQGERAILVPRILKSGNVATCCSLIFL